MTTCGGRDVGEDHVYVFLGRFVPFDIIATTISHADLWPMVRGCGVPALYRKAVTDGL